MTTLLIGTRRGTFLLDSDDRINWSVDGPHCESWPVYDVTWDEKSDFLYAGGVNAWYGPAIWQSPDRGKSWKVSSAGLTYGENPKIEAVWNVTPIGDIVYAGVAPAGLFASHDKGSTWNHVTGLREHRSVPAWQAGGGGLCLHTIIADPESQDSMWVGISAVGVMRTDDGGRNWEFRNKGLRSFEPHKEPPEFGYCVHKMKLAAGSATRMYQQNHVGVWRSDDAGNCWNEITQGLPSDFGFPMAVHPRNPDRIWVLPLNGAELGRYVPEGRPAVWRTSDQGNTWERCNKGLPPENAYLQVLREAMATDSSDPAGVYFGTTNGQVFASSDEGDSWVCAAAYLPPVLSVDAVEWS